MRIRSKLLATVTATACSVSLLTAACTKQEPATKAESKAPAAAPTGAAAPTAAGGAVPPAPVVALPDVALTDSPGVVGWVALRSLNATLDAIEAMGAKVGALPPGGSLRGTALAQLTMGAAQFGIKDLDWWDKTRPMVVGFHEETPVSPQASKSQNVFVVLPITQRDAALTAMTTAKKGAEANGHAALLALPSGEQIFVDFLDKHAVLTFVDTGRFAKVSGFAKQAAGLEPPSVIYAGVSLPELIKNHKQDVESLIKVLEQQSVQVAGGQGQDAAAANAAEPTVKVLRQWMDEGARVELLVQGDTQQARVEVRMQAKNGTPLAKQLEAGRGKLTRDMANLLPANSYFSAASNTDPGPQLEQLTNPAAMLKDFFELDQAAADQLAKDWLALAQQADGTSAVGAYPDGPSALGLTMVAGVKDAAVAVPLGKKVMGALIVALVKMKEKQEAQQQPAVIAEPSRKGGAAAKKGAAAAAKKKAATKAPASDAAKATSEADKAKLIAAIEQSAQEGKLEPLLAAIGPLASAKGLQITANTTRDGDVSCDSVDITIDAAKLAPADTAEVKAVIGDKTAVVLCGGKNRVAIAMGPSALEKAKAAVAGKVGGLADAPVYKATVAQNDGSLVMYLNLGALFAAFKPLMKSEVPVPADKAILASCRHRSVSFACGLDVPLDIIQAAVQATRSIGPAEGAGGGAVIPGGAPEPKPLGAPAPRGK